MADCCCADGTCRGHIPLEEIIKECDRLFNQENVTALGEHLRFWRRRAVELGDKKGELSVLSELMGHYRMIRNESGAVSAVRDGFALIRELGVESTAGAGTIYINGATALQSFGFSDEAMKHYRKAERCYRENLDPEDERFAGLFNNMASACIDSGDFDAAGEYYFKALQILENSGNFMDLAVTYVNLAQLYDGMDPEDEERINRCLDAAYDCFESGKVPRDGYFAHTCRKCAPAFGYFGRFLDEEKLRQYADEIYARS